MGLFTLGAIYDFSPEIFDGVKDGVVATVDERIECLTSIDVVEAILYRCEMFNTTKSDPYELRKAIFHWWNIRKPVFERMLRTTMYEYNPIHNYDRTETWTNTQKKSGKGDGTSGGNITEQRRAFDENMSDAGKTINAANTSTTYEDNGEVKHSAYISGNVGVTTTQEMLTAERNIAHYNVLENIAEDFKVNFCIVVY